MTDGVCEGVTSGGLGFCPGNMNLILLNRGVQMQVNPPCLLGRHPAITMQTRIIETPIRKFRLLLVTRFSHNKDLMHRDLVVYYIITIICIGNPFAFSHR